MADREELKRIYNEENEIYKRNLRNRIKERLVGIGKTEYNALGEDDTLLKVIRETERSQVYNDLGEDIYNRFFTDIKDKTRYDLSANEVVSRISGRKISNTIHKSNIDAFSSIIRMNRDAGKALFQLNFEDFKEHGLYKQLISSRQVGKSDAQVLLESMQRLTGMDFYNSKYSRINYSNLNKYAKGIIGTKLDTNLEYGLFDTMLQYGGVLNKEREGTKEVLSYLYNISNVISEEEFLAQDRGVSGLNDIKYDTPLGGGERSGFRTETWIARDVISSKDVGEDIIRQYDINKKYTGELAKLGSVYGDPEGPMAKKRDAVTKALSDITSTEDQKVLDELSEKYGFKVKKFTQITEKGKLTGKFDYSTIIDNAIERDKIINTKEYGPVKVLSKDSSGNVQVVKKAINPKEIKVPVKEILKNILGGGKQFKSKTMEHDLEQAINIIVGNIKKSDTTLLTYSDPKRNIDNQIQRIVNRKGLDTVLGKYKSVGAADAIEGFMDTNRAREDVINILYKKAGWALTSDKDRAISVANEAYKIAMNKMTDIKIIEGKTPSMYAAFISSFQDKFNAAFHQLYFDPAESKGLFKANPVLDMIIEQYERSNLRGSIGMTPFIHQAMGSVLSSVDDKYKYDIQPMSYEQIDEYLDKKYSMAVSGKNMAFQSSMIDELTGEKYGEPVQTTNILGREPNKDIYAERMFRKELNKIALTDAAKNLQGEITPRRLKTVMKAAETGNISRVLQVLGSKAKQQEWSKELAVAREIISSDFRANKRRLFNFSSASSFEQENMRLGLKNRVTAMMNVLGKSMTDVGGMSGVMQANIENEFVQAIDFKRMGILTKEETLELINNPEYYLGKSYQTFKNKDELFKLANTIGDLNIDGNTILRANKISKEVEIHKANMMDSLMGVVDEKPKVYSMMATSDYGDYIKPFTTEVMKSQERIELIPDLAMSKASKLGGNQIGYLPHSPVADIQSLRNILKGNEFVTADFETTGLKGKIADDLLIPTEYFGQRSKVTSAGGVYNLEKMDEGLRVFFKPTEAVKQEVSSIEAGIGAGEKISQDRLWMLRNYAKYSPELKNTPALYKRWIVDTKNMITPEEVGNLLFHSREGMKFLENAPGSLSVAQGLINISEYERGDIKVGQNWAAADESVFKAMGIANAMKEDISEEMKHKLVTYGSTKTELADLMGLHYLINPEAEGRAAGVQAKFHGIPVSDLSHLAKQDVETTNAILIKDINLAMKQDSIIRKALEDVEFYALRKGNVIAKVQGAVESDIVQGVYRFNEIINTGDGVYASLSTFGDNKEMRLAAENMTDLQHKFLGFVNIPEESAEEVYRLGIIDRSRRNIEKASTGYASFMRQKENALYAAGGEGRKKVIDNLRYTRVKFRQLERKLSSINGMLDSGLGLGEREEAISRQLSEQDKLLLMSRDKMGKDPIGFLGRKINRLKAGYADDSLSSDRIAIAKKTSELYDSKQGQIMENAMRKIQALESIPTYNITRNEGAELIRNMNQMIEARSRAKIEIPWLKQLGSYKDSKDISRDISLNIQSVDKAEAGIQGILKRMGTKDPLGRLVGIINERQGINITATNATELASRIVANAGAFESVSMADITVPITSTDAKELEAGINSMIDKHVMDKFKGVKDGEDVGLNILSRAEQTAAIGTGKRNLAMHYMNMGLGVEGITGENVIIPRGGGPITSVPELMTIATGYKQQDKRLINELKRRSINTFLDENNSRSRMEAKTKYSEMFYHDVNERISTQIEQLAEGGTRGISRKESKEAWRQLVNIATDREIAEIGSVKEEALNALGWKTAEQMADPSIDSSILSKQLMTTSEYAGYEMGKVPIDILEKYRLDPEETYTRQQLELRSRVSSYLDRLKTEGSIHPVEATVPFNNITDDILRQGRPYETVPSFVDKAISDAISKIQSVHTENISRFAPRPFIEPEVIQPIINEEVENIINRSGRFGTKAVIGIGIATAFAGALAGGIRYNRNDNTAAEEFENRKSTEGPGNSDWSKRDAPQKNDRTYIDNGATIKISAKNTKKLDHGDIANTVSGAVNGTINANIHVNTRDDSTGVTKSWIEDQFIDLLKK